MRSFKLIAVPKLVLVCLLLIINKSVYAAGTVNLPNGIEVPRGSINAGAINQTNFNNQPNLNITPLEFNIKETEKGNVDSSQLAKEKPAVYKISAKVSISKVIFKGNTVVKTEELEKLGVSLLNKEISVNDINDFVTKVTNLYEQKGYLTSYAYLPPQKLNNGTLEIDISEGKVGNIKVKGNKWERTGYITNNFLKADDFKSQDIFNVNNLKKGLDDVNNNDYLKGSVTLEKGQQQQSTDIVLDIKDKLPLSLDATWDNTGREGIGTNKAGIALTDYNITGFGDSLTSSTSLATRTVGENTLYSLPLGPYGDKLKFSYSLSRIALGGSEVQDNITGNYSVYSLELDHPLYKKNNLTVTSNISFDFADSLSIAHSYMYTLEHYNLRVLRAGFNAIKQDNYGKWVYNNQVSTGIPFLGATSASGNNVDSGTFVKLNAGITRLQALPLNSLLILRLSGQYSPTALYSSEQMQLGGESSVRGYEEGLLLGDSGYNFSIEDDSPIPFMPKRISIPYFPHKNYVLNLKDSIKFATFYDQGYAIAYGFTPTHFDFLQGLGCGLRIALTKFLTANLDLGIPLGRDRQVNEPRARLHFYLQSSLL